MLETRYLSLARLKREGWTCAFDAGKSYPPEVRRIAEMIRTYARRKTISEKMFKDAFKIFDMVKLSPDAE